MANYLSYSTLLDLHSCERFYQLQHLLEGAGAREESVHFSFGHCFGTGVASYLTHQDKDRAIFEAWLAYSPRLENEKKSISRGVALLQRAFSYLDSILDNYEIAFYKGKPCVELAFKLNINPNYYFGGHIDIILKHRTTGQHTIFECKTSGLLLYDLSPVYQHSGQALGYSIVLDAIVGEELSTYDVTYFIGQLGKDWADKIQVLNFSKTLLDRFNWFVTLGLDVKRLEEMESLGIYPKRGASCLKFNRPCQHFGICQLHGFDMNKKESAPFLSEAYDFEYDMDKLIQEHIERLNKV